MTPPEESAKQDALTSQDAWDDVRTALTKAALDKTGECIPVPPPCSSFVRARKKARRSGTHQQGRKRKQEEKGTNPEEQRAPGHGERESEGKCRLNLVVRMRAQQTGRSSQTSRAWWKASNPGQERGATKPGQAGRGASAGASVLTSQAAG